MAITTTEGLGNARGGYSNVQNSIAAGNGSQCGFCTPGMVMNMYSLLAANPHPSAADIENHLCVNMFASNSSCLSCAVPMSEN
eukprot:SAG31_NODE_846_length_11539_cov_70.858392_6_plen_83_part_00